MDILEGCQSNLYLSKLEKVATLRREKRNKIFHIKKKPENDGKWYKLKVLGLIPGGSGFFTFTLFFPL